MDPRIYEVLLKEAKDEHVDTTDDWHKAVSERIADANAQAERNKQAAGY